jgi:N-acetylglucosamine-6-phosphate deacetylase
MTMKAFSATRVLNPAGWMDDAAVLIADGAIAGVVPRANIPADAQIETLAGDLVPGFIDTQVNGGGGVLFNDQPTVDGLRIMTEAHRQFGTTAMLPTLISDKLEVIAQGIAAVEAAIDQGIPGIIGIHIEGPFLNSEKRGIHDADKFRTLDMTAVELLSSLKNGKTLVTLAPELAPPGMIKALAERGVLVAAGHSLASYDDIQRAMDEGLSGVTHLFNAMTQMEGRAPGIVGAALASNLYCGLIVDGHHVAPAALQAAYRAKGVKELMLVTDAMAITGTDMAQFVLGGREITLANGALRSSEGTLAGSALTMSAAVRNAVSMMKIELADACQMASSTPADFLGLGNSKGHIAPGYCADMVLLNDAGEVTRSWIGGA